MLRAVWLLCFVLACCAEEGVGGLSFRNLADRPVMLWWVSHEGEYHQQAMLDPGEQTGFQTYTGHRFVWSEMVGSEEADPEPIGGFEIEDHRMIYAFVDESTTPEQKQALEAELLFKQQYLERHGIAWTGTSWPRPAVTLPMIRPERVGQRIEVPLTDPAAAWWTCAAPDVQDCVQGGAPREPQAKQVRVAEALTIEVVSTHPRAFVVPDFLSEFEADYIIHQTKHRLVSSTVGDGKNAMVDRTRTSKSAWLERSHSAVMDAVYRRLALVTRLPEALLWEHSLAEPLNVLNYPRGAEYSPHFDWAPDGNPHSRWLSGLIYLNTPTKGGATAFPKAAMPDGSTGTTVAAQKRSLVFFYNLLEDGNGDVLSVHAGMPVVRGEKWVAPLWLWEPSRSGEPHGHADLTGAREEL